VKTSVPGAIDFTPTDVDVETFIDNVDRLAFDDWAGHGSLYPEGGALEETALFAR
jgi:hypothetical protein